MKVCKKGLDFKLFQDRESLGWGAEENLWRTEKTISIGVWLSVRLCDLLTAHRPEGAFKSYENGMTRAVKQSSLAPLTKKIDLSTKIIRKV